ncbi:MAG: lipoprotein [Gammaproteobacteria bacterium]|nr:lipoprotein [Gammaproteobacteria bacterium]
MRTLVAAISITLCLPLVAGCGQMGPLYMPEEESAPATVPATPAEPPAEQPAAQIKES